MSAGRVQSECEQHGRPSWVCEKDAAPCQSGRVRSFWIGGHKAGKTTTQRGEVDVAVALGKHVHTFGEEGARCYNGDCDLTMPTISRSTAPLDLDNLPVSPPARTPS
jgi:hypothetical protein